MKSAFVLVLAAALLVGCRAPLHTRTPLDPTDIRPLALLQSLVKASTERTSLNAALRMSLDSEDLRFRRPQRLAVRSPSDLRIEVLALFGQIAAVLVTDGESYQSMDSDGDFESGPVAQDLLWRIARVALQPEDAVDLLLGVPIPSDDASFAGAFIDTRGTLSLDFRDANGVLTDRCGFNEAGQLSEFVRFEDDGKVAWEATFSDYREVSGSPFAFEVDLKFPEVDATASLQFDHAALGAVLADELFVLRPRTSAVNQ